MTSVASLESSSSAVSSRSSNYDDYDEEHFLAQQEWEESIEQLQTLVSLVILPFLGKWMGRKWSHWAYARYLSVGLGRTFFFGGLNTVAQSLPFKGSDASSRSRG